MPTYKDINLLSQKAAVVGTEKLPVSDTEYIIPSQIISDLQISADSLKNLIKIWGQNFDGTGDVNGDLSLNKGVAASIGVGYSANVPTLYNKITFSPADYNGDIVYMGGDWTGTPHPAHIFKTRGVNDALVIQSVTGNVGIGKVSPSQRLDVYGNVLASSFIKDGGTSSQFLKADGSVDSNTYATTTDLENAIGDIETLLASI